MKVVTRSDSNVSMDASFNGSALNVEHFEGVSIVCDFTDDTPVSGDTLTSGTYEIQTLTFPTKAAATHQDFVVAESAAGVKYAVALTKPVAEVQTLTFPDKATAVHQDYIVVQDTAGVKYAVALTKPVAEVQTLTFPAFASITDGDYIVVEDTAGVKYAVYADMTGITAAPTGALYVAATHKVKADISGAGTAASVAAIFETAFNTLTGFTAAITTDDTAADGTMTLTQVIKAPTTNPVPKNADDSGAGTLAGVQTTAGVASVAPSGAAWTAATYKGLADISADTTAANVAARAETAFNALTGFTAAITSDDTAADGTMLLTQVIKAPVVDPVPKNENDSGAGTITGVQTTAGVQSVAPSGVIWTAATYKGLADISGDTTAAQVAARAETAFNALTGFTAAITSDDTAADGTMLLTQVAYGPTTNPVVKNANEAGAGSIAGVQSTGGVVSKVDLTGDTLTIAAHGYYTGLKIQLTTTGTLPTGITTATDYFVIEDTANTFQLASSLVNALASTEINLSAEGNGTHTVAVQDVLTGTLKIQISNNGFNGNVNNNESTDAVWVDYTSSSQAVSGASSVAWSIADVYFKCLRLVWTRTVGHGTIDSVLHAKGPN